MSNEDVYHSTCISPVSEDIKTRRWRWIGHKLGRDRNNDATVALNWALEVKGREEDHNQQGEGMWKPRENTSDGHLGRWHRMQLEIA